MASRLALANGIDLVLLVDGADHLLLAGGQTSSSNATSTVTNRRTNPSTLTITAATSTPTDSDG